LLNELITCSSANSTSFSDNCPESCIKFSNPYWNAASRDFARKAKGNAMIVLNGTRTSGAISINSTFLNYELPELNSQNLKQLKVLLLHTPSEPKFETCRQPKTLKILEEELNQKNVTYLCEDNPGEIVFLLCFVNPFSKECQAVQYLLNNSFNLRSNISVALSSFLVLFFLNVRSV
jgi:hypothetical protein